MQLSPQPTGSHGPEGMDLTAPDHYPWPNQSDICQMGPNYNPK